MLYLWSYILCFITTLLEKYDHELNRFPKRDNICVVKKVYNFFVGQPKYRAIFFFFWCFLSYLYTSSCPKLLWKIFITKKISANAMFIFTMQNMSSRCHKLKACLLNNHITLQISFLSTYLPTF